MERDLAHWHFKYQVLIQRVSRGGRGLDSRCSGRGVWCKCCLVLSLNEIDLSWVAVRCFRRGAPALDVSVTHAPRPYFQHMLQGLSHIAHTSKNRACGCCGSCDLKVLPLGLLALRLLLRWSSVNLSGGRRAQYLVHGVLGVGLVQDAHLSILQGVVSPTCTQA